MVNKDDYMLRIAQAAPAQLVVINYEIVTAYLKDALAVCGENAAVRTEDKLVFASNMEKAKNALTLLIGSLDLTVTVAQVLFWVYEYIEKLLNDAFFGYDHAAAAEALELLETLLVGWRDAARQEAEALPAGENAPQVYAGLTYQKDGLSEYVEQDESRGYKA
jgi:flagellin-specific chaperone FliS